MDKHRKVLQQPVHVKSIEQVVPYIRLQRIVAKAEKDVEIKRDILARVSGNSDLLDTVMDRLQHDEIVE